VRKLRKQGTVVVADVDDLIIHEQWAEYSPGVLNGILSLGKTREQYKRNRRGLALFDHISASTEPLAEKLDETFAQSTIHILHNTIHWRWRQPGAHFQEPPHRKQLTYFPGTRSHDRDFRRVVRPLEAFLDQQPDIELHITGVLSAEVKARPGQVIQQNKKPFLKFAQCVSNSWVNLAPLEDTPFNRSKSALKVIEAGYWNRPTLCSPKPDMARFEGCGAILVDTPDDWLTELNRLLDENHYQSHINGLREHMLEKADVYQSARQLIELASQK